MTVQQRLQVAELLRVCEGSAVVNIGKSAGVRVVVTWGTVSKGVLSLATSVAVLALKWSVANQATGLG